VFEDNTTKPDIVGNICLDRNLVQKDIIDDVDDKKRFIASPYEIPSAEYNSNFNNTSMFVTPVSIKFNPSQELEQIQGYGNTDIGNVKTSIMEYKKCNKTFHNDNENISGNFDNRNYGVLLKRNDDCGRSVPEKDNDNGVQNNNDLERKPKIGRKIQEKMVLFDTNVVLPTISTDAIESLEKRDKQLSNTTIFSCIFLPILGFLSKSLLF
jgi:hypothetical protein